MSLRFLLLPFACLLGACALGGCASLPGPDLPTCDGKARRPANPHGSVLSPDTAAPPKTIAATEREPVPAGGCA